MEVISSKSFEDESSEENNDQNTYTNKINNNMIEDEDDEEFDNNLNEMELNGINEINELDEEDEESENKYINKNNIEEHYDENEISNSLQNLENNTINTIDEENDEMSNNNEKNNDNYLNIYQEIEMQMPFILPLIILKNDKYEITEQAKSLLEQIGNNKMSIISLFSNDKYYEDKFNILNKLMSNNLNNNNYFKFNGKNSIIMYKKPLMINNINLNYNFNKEEKDEFPCFIIDIFNLDINDSNSDFKIFIIMILISSVFLFISKDIDEDSFIHLNLILKIIKTIKIRNITEEDNNNELYRFLPNLFWILINNKIKTEDKNGNTITEKEYMENCLKLINSNNEHIEEINSIKSDIKNYFKDRECIVSMENDNLFTYNDINDKNMRNKIIKKIKPKNFFGHLFTGNMILELIESILDCINKGGTPIIYNLWKFMMKREFMKCANNLIYKFSSELKDYRNKSINSNDFLNSNKIERHKNNLLEKYMQDFLNTNIINEEIKKEYKEKLKSKLETELNKYSKENEKYFEDKFIKELNLLSNKFMENFTSSDIYEKNSYKFFQDFEDFREIAVQKTPDFPRKNEILFDKILLIIKKFINGKIMKIKVINEEKNYLEKENKNRENQIDVLNKELDLIKSKNYEYIQKISNEIKIEKKKNKHIEDKMNRLINNKSKEIDNLNKQIEIENLNYDKKIKEISESNKNLEKEIKIKNEQIIVMKMNNDKVSSLYGQKSNFLEKEIKNWKDKYNSVIKEALVKQNELTKENLKLKEENKILVKKENKRGLENNINNITNNNNINNNDNNSMNNTIKNKNVRNNINGLLTYIKMNLKEKKSKMIRLDKYFLNKKKQSQERVQEVKDSTKENSKEQIKNKISNSNTAYTSDKKNSIPLENNNNNEHYNPNKTNIKNYSISNINLNNIGNNNYIYNENRYLNKTENLRNIKKNIINNNSENESTYCTNTFIGNYKTNKNINSNNNNKINYNPEKMKIKIIKGRIRKDKTGKPYLEYIININYDNSKIWNINRRFNQFTNLNKALKVMSQDNFELPKSSNIFSNITALFSGLSHENKIIQLEKYLKDLTETPEINNSKQLIFFLELNHLYEIN